MTGKEDSPLAAVETAGVAFDPTTQHLDLTKDEKRRTTALMLAIQGYKELIIRDAEYLREMHKESRRSKGAPVIRPATMNAIVEAAIQFDDFIAGNISSGAEAKPITGGAKTETATPDTA